MKKQIAVSILGTAILYVFYPKTLKMDCSNIPPLTNVACSNPNYEDRLSKVVSTNSWIKLLAMSIFSELPELLVSPTYSSKGELIRRNIYIDTPAFFAKPKNLLLCKINSIIRAFEPEKDSFNGFCEKITINYNYKITSKEGLIFYSEIDVEMKNGLLESINITPEGTHSFWLVLSKGNWYSKRRELIY